MILREISKTYLESGFEDIPQFLAHSIAWVFNFEGPPLGNDLLSREGPLRVSPSRVRPPFLHGVDVRLIKLVLMVFWRHWDGEKERFLACQNYLFEDSCSRNATKVRIVELSGRGSKACQSRCGRMEWIVKEEKFQELEGPGQRSGGLGFLAT